MIMNDIEKYFDNYRSLADEAGADPSVSEQDFLGRLHKERARKRFRRRTIALTFVGMAAALTILVILRCGRGLYDELSGRRGAAAFGGTGDGDVFRTVQGNGLVGGH